MKTRISNNKKQIKTFFKSFIMMLSGLEMKGNNFTNKKKKKA